MGEGRHKLNGGWSAQVTSEAMAQETPSQERALTRPHGMCSGLQRLCSSGKCLALRPFSPWPRALILAPFVTKSQIP